MSRMSAATAIICRACALPFVLALVNDVSLWFASRFATCLVWNKKVSSLFLVYQSFLVGFHFAQDSYLVMGLPPSTLSWLKVSVW